jgi:hypothetical protein
MRILFEPFECRRVPEFAELGLRPYFAPNAPLPHWRAAVEKLLAGAIGDPWIDQDASRLDPTRDTGGIVIKEIRANGMLAWLCENFPCQVVYLVRHPCAVIASRIKLGWDTHLDAYTCQPDLMDDYLSPFTGVIEAASTPVQKHAVMWCLENLVPLRQMPGYNWIFCSYEQLFLQPEEEAARILDRLGLEFNTSRRQALGELSRTCSAQQAGNAQDFLSDWKGALSSEDREEVAAILCSFGIDLYDTQSALPLRRSDGP